MLGFSAAGVPMNDDAALSITTVFACISLIADGVATLPFNALKRTKDRSKKLIDPAPALVDNPWPEGTRVDFFTQMMVSLLLRGNFFGQVVDRDAAGYATTVMPIHPDTVVARRARSGEREYRVGGALVPAEDMIHIPALLVPGSFIGLNPVEYQRGAWALSSAAEKYGGQFFANSAHPSGIISVDSDLSPEEALEFRREWQQSHGGLGNAQYPAVLTGGAKWQQMSLAPEDAQFLQTRTFQQQQIASWFRVPPHKIGVQDRTPGPTMNEELEMAYVTDGLLPWAVKIEAHFSRRMRPSHVAKFDFSGRLRGNTLQRFQAHQISANTGIETLDEIRAQEDKEPLPNGLGAVIARPMNMTYYDTSTGDAIVTPSDPSVGASNPGGFGDGGGDPANTGGA